METLEPPDSHHLLAAIGWLELKNHVEAGTEISKITPDRLEHPDVLEVRWQVCAAGGSWQAAADVAALLREQAPERASGWIHGAYAIRRMKGGGLQQAWDLLLPAFAKFPKELVIPYNLACYAAQFGRLEEAWEWLHKAMEAGDDVAVIKAMALSDADLEPLRDRIRQL